MEAMESAKKFCWKHRVKIGLGAVAIAGGVALYYYLNHQEESHPGPNQSREGQRPTSDLPSPSSGEEEMKSPSKDFESRRSPPESDSERENLDEQRLLVAVNELYGFSLVYFLPNVRSRLKDLIDVSETIQRLKDLKNDHSDESRDMKVSLWNNIKISSFTTLLATVYAISAVSVLLHVQMHILVRDTVKITSSGLENSGHQDEDIFRALLEGSYAVFFGKGLERLTARVKEVVTLQVSDWSVESRLNVELYDVIETIGSIRKELEAETPKLVNLLMLPETDSETDLKSSAAPPMPTQSPEQTQTSLPSRPSSAMLQALIQQTFDTVTSPVFHAAFEETLQSAFDYVEELFRVQAFTSAPSPASPSSLSPSSDSSVTKNLPLASLLPKVKSLTARLIPEELGRNPQCLIQIKKLSSGPQVSSLCSRIFIASTGAADTASPLVGSSGSRAFSLPSTPGTRQDSPLPKSAQRKGTTATP